MKTIRGFTLIELLITLVLVGILAGVGLPALANLMRNNQITGQTSALAMSLTAARSEAIKRRENITVNARGGDWSTGWTINDSGGNTLRDHNISAPVTIVEAGGATSVTYQSDGLTTAGAALNFNISHSDCTANPARVVRVSPTGSVSITNNGC